MKKLLLISALALFAAGPSMAQCPAGQDSVKVMINTDAYGNETTWTLTGANGTPSYASGGPYAQQSAAGSFPQTPVLVCLENGSVAIFTIYDGYGDGICCQYGQGSYSVTSGAAVVATGSSFGASAQTIFQVGAPAQLDLALATLNLPVLAAAGNMNITGTAVNFGTTGITNFVLNYSVDNGAVQTQTITANIAVGANYTFTHPTPWNATVGTHAVKVWTSAVNGGPDVYAINDTVQGSAVIATQQVPRVATVEEFGSSTCPPCFPYADKLEPALANLNANMPGSSVASIAYHMNWPSPGDDRSYNPDGNLRRGFYGVSGIPSPWVDGHVLDGNSTGTITTSINAALSVPSFMNIDLTYTVNGNTVTATAVVTPRFNGPSGSKLYLAILENSYVDNLAINPYSNTPPRIPYEYHDIMRKMLPNGSGNALTAFTADQPQTVIKSFTLVEGGAAQGNYNLWGSISGISVVGFVQNTSTKEIYQGAIGTAVVGINELENNNNLLGVWPNPTSGIVSMTYAKASTSAAHVEVFNVLGERVMDLNHAFASTKQIETLDLGGLENGMYLLSVTVDGIRSTSRVTLNK